MDPNITNNPAARRVSNHHPSTARKIIAMATDAPSKDVPKPRPDPGPRAQRLQQVHAASLGKTLDKLSWDNFKQCYPVATSRAESTMRKVHTQMVEQLRKKCKREFESILDNRDVIALLNELERLADDAAARREVHPEELEIPTPYVFPGHGKNGLG